MSYISDALQTSFKTLKTFIDNPAQEEKISKATALFIAALKNKKKIISCGNGGSLCDAAHFTEELTGRFRKDRRALAALCISEPGHLTCVGNDYGYDHIFSKYIEGLGLEGDVLLAISTSGNSPNIIKACEMARQQGMKIVGLSGKNGGKLKDLADVCLIVESDVTDRIQEVHIKIIHIFIEGIERSLFPENY